jgi:hypothetical protein
MKFPSSLFIMEVILAPGRVIATKENGAMQQLTVYSFHVPLYT